MPGNQLPVGFPQDAWDWIVAMTDHDTPEPTLSWEKAWSMASTTVQHLSPKGHLLRYLASCSHRSLRPSPVTWIRFLVDDDRREAREIAVEVELRLREDENEQARREQLPPELVAWRRQYGIE